LNTKLYVGNLSYEVADEQLTELFSKAGKVASAIVLKDQYSGRSRGFGFVEMGSEEEAKKAIELFNEKDFEGRKMIVNEARPRNTDSSQGRRDFGPRR
jgi:RNA recognition motif-containing protein